MASESSIFSEQDHFYMERALDWAERGDRQPGGSPIGCVIVANGDFIGEGFNETELRCDPTSHAEMVAMRMACAHVRQLSLRNATLYTTLQPCGMCIMAMIWAKLPRVVFGAERHQVHEMYFEDRHLTTQDFVRDAYRRDIVLSGGLLAERCAKLCVRPWDDVPVAEQANL